MGACIACSGTGKTVGSMTSVGTAILKTCPMCSGTGLKPPSVIKINDVSQDELTQMLKDLQVKEKKVTKAKKTALPAVGTGIGEIAKQVAVQVGTNVVDATMTEFAMKANTLMIQGGKDLLTSFGIQVPDNPNFDRFLGMLMPALIQIGCQTASSHEIPILPKALLEHINTAAAYAQKGATQETVQKVTAVALPFLGQMAQLGAGLASGQLMAGDIPGQETPNQAIVLEETTT